MTTAPTPAVTPPNWGQQLLDYIDTAAGAPIDYAENGTGTTTTFGVSASPSTVVLGCQIIVPASTRYSLITWGGEASVSVVGGGLLSLELWDTSALIKAATLGIVASQAVLYSGLLNSIPAGHYELAPQASDKTLLLKALLYRDTSSSLAASMANSAAQPTWIKAVGQ